MFDPWQRITKDKFLVRLQRWWKTPKTFSYIVLLDCQNTEKASCSILGHHVNIFILLILDLLNQNTVFDEMKKVLRTFHCHTGRQHIESFSLFSQTPCGLTPDFWCLLSTTTRNRKIQSMICNCKTSFHDKLHRHAHDTVNVVCESRVYGWGEQEHKTQLQSSTYSWKINTLYFCSCVGRLLHHQTDDKCARLFSRSTHQNL